MHCGDIYATVFCIDIGFWTDFLIHIPAFHFEFIQKLWLKSIGR